MYTSELPEKLQRDLRKPYPALRSAFAHIANTVRAECPNVRIKSVTRYSAFYKGRSIVAHIEPQKDKILFGFSESIVDGLHTVDHLERDPYPREWSGRRRLAWFSVGLINIEEEISELEALVIRAFRSTE